MKAFPSAALQPNSDKHKEGFTPPHSAPSSGGQSPLKSLLEEQRLLLLRVLLTHNWCYQASSVSLPLPVTPFQCRILGGVLPSSCLSHLWVHPLQQHMFPHHQAPCQGCFSPAVEPSRATCCYPQPNSPEVTVLPLCLCVLSALPVSKNKDHGDSSSLLALNFNCSLNLPVYNASANQA